MKFGAVVLALASATAWADSAVVLFPALGTPSAVTVSGRVWKHAPGGGSSALSANLRRLSASGWMGADVEVRYAGLSVHATADSDGDFKVTLRGERPFEIGSATAEAFVSGATVGSAVITILSPEAGFFVVSDFDDTLAVTNVVKTSGLVKAALLQDERNQPAVEGMAELYQCLEEQAMHRPAFALVSGSPVQYVGRVRKFLVGHRFPPFSLYLRELGPNTLSGYKQPIIRELMKSVPNDVVLIGDSGEHDPEVYSELRAEFPKRVKAVYIRRAGHEAPPERFEDMVLFSHPREAGLDAVQRGLMSRECLDRRLPEGAKP